jgi:GNAT superfamily N-acetyltransferase
MTNLEIVQNHLSNFSLYKLEHHVHCLEKDNVFYIGYQSDKSGNLFDRRTTTHFDVQVQDGVFYILSIQLEEKFRGKGLGFQLYSILEQMAKNFGCHTIEMTPSGWTQTKETRADYVCRKLGYQMKGQVAVKSLREV